MKRFILPLGFFAGILLLLAFSLGEDPRERPSPMIGQPAPVFRLTQLHDPQKVFSAADMAGQVWLLNVWASWCGTCRQEHADLMQLARQSTIPVVGLNYKDQREAASRWLQHLGNPYRLVAVDDHGRVGSAFGVYGVPETFIIDKHGIIRWRHAGPLTPAVIRAQVRPLLEELSHA